MMRAEESRIVAISRFSMSRRAIYDELVFRAYDSFIIYLAI